MAGWDEAIEAAREAAPGKRNQGHPGRRGSSLDWVLAERMYVYGELVPAGDTMVRVFPTFRAIADRIGTSKENVCGRALRYGWRDLRRAAKLDRMADRSDDPAILSEVHEGIHGDTSRKKKARSPEEILLEYLEVFDVQLQRGRIKADCIADLDKAIRTLAFVRGQADSRREVHTTVSLEVLQAKHATYRVAPPGVDTDEIAGVLGTGTGSPMVIEAEAEVSAVDSEGRAYDRGGNRVG